jgi:hypothetical protein
MIEKRKFKRYLPDSRAFACLRPGFQKLGKIMDISMGGLAFSYISDKDSIEKSHGVDIFLSGNNFFLNEIGCRVVYSYRIYSYLISGGMLNEWKCGIKFVSATENQRRELKAFLNNHTKGKKNYKSQRD